VAGLRRVCVYCGSNPGVDPAYRAAAEDTARLLAGRGIEIVYGGGAVGLMGALADAALQAGGRVTGVIPQALVDKEIGHPGLTDLRVVGSMHERKMLMADLADAFIALPGGIGTLEEIIEVLTWTQLGLHRKPCALLDVAGFYAPLRAFLDHAVAEGFLGDGHRGMLLIDDDTAALLAQIECWEAPTLAKWVQREDV
jgi:uncharacterized protein (TIGR00730 family)